MGTVSHVEKTTTVNSSIQYDKKIDIQSELSEDMCVNERFRSSEDSAMRLEE